MPDIFHNPAAFACFFTDVITVEGLRAVPSSSGSGTAARKVSGTFRACVFDNGFADPFAEADADTNARSFSVSVRSGDWIERTPPQVGDKITLELDGLAYRLAVSRIDTTTGDIWSITAKEVK
jgi:hypothetical protein